jgi:putative ABC transport system permease protein
MVKKVADSLLLWFCHPDFYPDIKGDLEELYERNSSDSKFKAIIKYLLQVMVLFRPSLMKSFNLLSIVNSDMLSNYFKIGVRTLARQKLFTFINIIGLAFGLAAYLMINEYVRFERSYDSQYDKSSQIYRVATVEKINGVATVKDANAFSLSANALFDELPEVVNFTSTFKFDGLTFRMGDKVFREANIVTADTNFLEIFTHTVLQGSKADMLKEPYSIVLTKSKAEFYFGTENPIGQTIDILDNYNRPFKVTGVIEDVADNTHYKFDILISHRSIESRRDFGSWNNNNYYGYVVLADQVKYQSLNAKLTQLSKKYLGDDSDDVFDLFPIQDIHLKSDYIFEPSATGNASAVGFMSLISFFILIIAWVNYINLSTARALQRAKEVGLRKVIGAFKTQLIVQFLLEALMVNLIAALLALIIAEASLPYYNSLIGTILTNHIWNYFPFLQNLLIFFIIGTFVSGFYPALALSGFKPAIVLRGNFSKSTQGTLLRKGLVVFQFTASIVLIAGTLIVNKQLKFMQEKDIGISIDYVIGFPLPEVDRDQSERHNILISSFKEELRNHSAIDVVGATSNLPGGSATDINTTTDAARIVGISEEKDGITYVQWNDDHFLDAVNMQLLAGRDFDRNIQSDSSAILVNEAYLQKFNIYDPDSILNEHLQIWGTEFKLIGIVKNYSRMSLKSAVEPTMFMPDLSPSNLVIKLKPEQYLAGLEFIEHKWEAFFPDNPLDYSFLDQRFKKLYQQDERFGEVYLIFSILAILIASLGLLGLSSFMAIQRTKEVGVRKVLGASIPSIIAIFYKDFFLLLMASAVLAIPLVYYSMNFWLANYAFRIDFPWVMPFISILVVISFAFITIGLQTYKVAILNPAKTLKYE